MSAGRWPANVILSPGMAAILDQQSGKLKSGARPAARGITSTPGANGTMGGGWSGFKQEEREVLDSGGASRFFLEAGYEPDELAWIYSVGLRPYIGEHDD